MTKKEEDKQHDQSHKPTPIEEEDDNTKTYPEQEFEGYARTAPVEKRKEATHLEGYSNKKINIIKPRSTQTLKMDHIEKIRVETKNVVEENIESMATKIEIEELLAMQKEVMLNIEKNPQR